MKLLFEFVLLLSCGTIHYTASFQQLSRIPAALQSTRFFSERGNPSTKVFSLQHLYDDIVNSPPKDGPMTLFVGGKGGVGKTTVSSAIAVKLASAIENNLKVLVVSTDPAHSLGDALDENLRVGHGKPVPMTDPVTGGRLYACEVDSVTALEEFRSSLAAFDVERLAESLGVSPDLLESLGLQEFSGLLNNPPPGLDELVALSNVLDTDGSMAGDFDVVVVDTAPTGHTLRLLALPQFLDGLLGKLINLRLKLSGLTSTLQSFFGNEEAQQRAKTIDNAVERIDRFKRKMAKLQETLKSADKTRFVVVTVPTKLGVAESKRLISELTSQGVLVSDIVVNQCISNTDSDDSEALVAYYERRQAGQEKWVKKLSESVASVSSSDEFRSNGNPTPIGLTSVPFFDVELVGVPALYYLGSQCFTENPYFSHLMEDTVNDDPKVVICGGKGGVGKTTTSSSLAVSMAAMGHKVALISTDPAHSLGDAIDMDLHGGKLIDCPLIGCPPSEGSLSVLEIDPSSALNQFKGVVDQLVNGDSGSAGGVKDTLKDIQEIFDTLPAGADEVVALAKIIELVKKGGFDRIVLDTAPTGHTLRMLSTPSFLAELIERLLRIANKINSNAAVRMFLSASTNSEQYATAVETAKSTLLKFQFQMYDLEDLFADAQKTEFLIVTVPTELATRETIRLLNDLTFEAPDMPIKVRNVVVNQVLKGDGSDSKDFLGHVRSTQIHSIDDLSRFMSSMPRPAVLTQSNYLDTEPRGVFGLKILSDELFR